MPVATSQASHTLDALRDDLEIDQATDATYAVLHHEIWTRLVEECDWSPEDFEAWCADLLRRMLLAHPMGATGT